jgi:Rrf2 family protein
MAANTRLAVAIHALGMLAFGDKLRVTSEDIAESVGTNPVVARRILAQLARGGLIEVKLGAGGGSRLAREPEKITLAEVYAALEEGPLFQVPVLGEAHGCAVGRNVGPVLTGVLRGAEQGLWRELAALTLADVIGQVMRRLCGEEFNAETQRRGDAETRL